MVYDLESMKRWLTGFGLLILFQGVSWACTDERSPIVGDSFYQRTFSRDCTREERSVPAVDLLEALRRGKGVRVQRGIIVGTLDLSQAVVNGKVQGSVMLLDSEVLGGMRGEGIHFLGDLLFWNSLFDGKVDLTESQFSRFVDFRGALFRDEVRFAGDVFQGSVGFIGVAFGGQADFSKTSFDFPAGFGRTTFSKNAVFSEARFGHHADFSWTTFAGRVGFRRATFFKSADFSWTNFSESADFTKSEFFGKGVFQRASFSKDLSFDGARFHQGSTTLGLRYRGFGRYLGWLLYSSFLSLFLLGFSIYLTKNYSDPRSLLRDRPFLLLSLVHLAIVLVFYFYATLVSRPPSRREFLIFLTGFYSLFAAATYPAYLFASTASHTPLDARGGRSGEEE
jgi:uncharacterized protein YjbI with pentapeptide repeats